MIYIAIWNDRHTDTTAHPFSDPVEAIDWARKKAREYDSHGDYEERDVTGWLFCADYSCEGDCIYIIESEIDGDLAP